MNAYELANKMEQLAGHFHNEAINMLRQQADRIAQLEKKCKWYDDTYRLPTDQQSAEPFIWLKQDFDGEWIEVHPNKGIPLYTAPRELSDEEINELVNKYLYVLNDVPYANDIKDFAKAILKKASKK